MYLKHIRTATAVILMLVGLFCYAGHVKLKYTSRACASEQCVGTIETFFLVREEAPFYIFEDWIRPLVWHISTVVPVLEVSFESARTRTFNRREVVLLVQKTHGLPRQAGVEYWFMNTEGPDKDFAENALKEGYENVIDFTLKGVERMLASGAKRALWLPIIKTPGLPVFASRTYLCMVGEANTPRRQQFFEDLKRRLDSLEYKVPWKQVTGFSGARDFESQRCALVVHYGSTEDNRLAARLRIDILWLYDIPVISELVDDPDLSEYDNTIEFFESPALINAIIAKWNVLHSDALDIDARVLSLNKRLQIQSSRTKHFSAVVQQLLGSLQGSERVDNQLH